MLPKGKDTFSLSYFGLISHHYSNIPNLFLTLKYRQTTFSRLVGIFLLWEDFFVVGIHEKLFIHSCALLSLLGILFEMKLLNLSITFIADFCPHLGSFCCFSHYVSAEFHLWLITWRQPELKVGRNVVRKTTKITKMRTKVRNKINTCALLFTIHKT